MHSKHTHLHFPGLFSTRWLVIVLLSLSATAAHAQSARGVIVGHVQHKVTQESLKNAEVAIKGAAANAVTDSGGDYVLSGVPAGEVILTVTYLGMLTQEKRITVPAGGRVTADFDMVPDNFDVGAKIKPGEAKPEDVVQLEKFVVSGEFEGNARALMEQRNKIGVSQIVATDAFGETASGNVAEFMRYMPGVTFGFNDAEISTVSIGGADPDAVGVTIDGIKMAASGGGGTDRAMQWNLFSMSSIESIEVDLTGGADSPAGAIRLKTKGAFDQKGRRLNYRVFASGNTYQTNFSRTPGGDDGYSRKTTVGFDFNYSEAFFRNRIGFSFGLSHIPHYSYTDHLAMSYGNATEEYFTTPPQSGKTIPAPYISAINYKDGNNSGFADSVYGKIDFKINAFGKMAIGVNYSEKKNEFFNRGYTFGGIDGAKSSITHVQNTVNSSGTPTGTLNANYSVATSNKLSDSFGVTFNLDYNLGRFKFDMAAGFTKASTDYEMYNDTAPYFNTFPASIGNVGYTANRSGPRSTDWQFTWTGGKDWTNPASWDVGGSDSAKLISGRNSHSNADTLQAVANLTWAAPTRFPLDLKLTLQGSRDKRFGTNSNYYETWVFTPTTPGFADFVSPYTLNPRMGDNIPSLGLPYPDRSALYRSYVNYSSIYDAALEAYKQAHGGDSKGFVLEGYDGPVFALTDSARFNALRRELDPGTETMETLAAATLRLTVKPHPRLDIQADLRYDFTDQQSIVMLPLTTNEMGAMGFQASDANTPEYIKVQLRNGERSTPTNTFSFWLPTVAARFKFTDRLMARVSYSKSIGRIPISRLAGRWAYSTNVTINGTLYPDVASAPNPNLLPDPSRKLLVALSYDIKGGGNLSATYSQTSWNGSTDEWILVNPDPDPSGWDTGVLNNLIAAYGSEYIQNLINSGFVIRTYGDANRMSRSVNQFTLSYTQPLPFTNKKVNVMASFTRTLPNWLRASTSGYAQDRSASGSISYNDRYVNTRLGFTWVDRNRYANPGAWNESWYFALLNVNFEASLKINKRFNPYLVIYNLTNEDGFDSRYTYSSRNYITRVDHPGIRFTIGVKGDF